jgi:predicted acylesterase/phospholipase RssA
MAGILVRYCAAAIVAGLWLGGCSGPAIEELRDPVPEPYVAAANVPGYTHIRFWGDDAASLDPAAIQTVAAQAKAAAKADPGIDPLDRKFLSISGGGSNGAFGAGLITGWTEAGNRPKFDVVTGISTGALIAPMAFLGPPYDAQLREAYTEVTGDDLYRKKNILGIIGSESVADNIPLRRLVARFVTDRMIADVASEHAKGRRLLVGTTNIDAERPVVWDMGAIASSGEPGRKQLFQDILAASASIPGVFPPIRLNVQADGRKYDELHVDGGTSNQAFLFPTNFSPRDVDKLLGAKRKRTLYVIRNGKVTPEWSAVKPRLASIAGKSIASLIKTQGIGDLYRMYANAKRDGIAFNAIWIPASFELKEKEPFEQSYMRALFKLGYETGKNGIPWSHVPPG